jgi:death-on-curing protein
MISTKQVLRIHQLLIDQFGGSSGIRDIGVLESAINRPYQTFDGNDLYPQSTDKAAAILESIVKNHPFVDGNKRTGYVLMRLILLENKEDIDASQDEKYELVIKVASGTYGFDEIKDWLKSKMISL